MKSSAKDIHHPEKTYPKVKLLLQKLGINQAPTLYSRFEKIAHLYAEKSAIEYGEQKLSYKGLLAEVEKIAKILSRLESKEPARVAMFFENRVHAVSAIFAILKSGHAFVPLDPADPEARINAILGDSKPIAILTDTINLHHVKKIAAHLCPVIDIEAPQESRSNTKNKSRAQGLAYLFYTSGSTGKPKGVRQTHRNFLYFIDTYVHNLQITAQDRLSLLYSLSFSAANMDIFGALLNGATLCAYDMRQQGIPGLELWIEVEKISVLHAVPTVFRKLTMSLGEGKIFNQIRALDLGGEAVTGKDVELFRNHFSSSCLFFNRLASTEVCMIAQYPVSTSDARQDILPVGYSPKEVEVCIQRADGSVANTGELGRIVISSPYVSPGYWQQPSLNETCFSDDPSRLGWKVFRTEDTGYLDAAGLLYFRGRDGTRVKIRGHSVDLTEVEAAARQCNGVRDVAVVTANREHSPEADILVVHLVIGEAGSNNPVTLRRELATRLPHYMLPTVFIFTEALPLTASGKIDRRTLQQQVLPTDGDTIDQTLMPINETEVEVAQLFKELLNKEDITRDDDFFLVGGDSLSAVNLQIVLSRILAKNFPLEALIEDSTVTGIADRLCKLRKSTVKSLSPVLVPLRENGDKPILFLVHGRLGQAPVSPQFLSLFGDRQSIYALQARGLENGDAPNTTVEAMAKDYVEAIRMVQPTGPYLVGGLCAGGYVAMLIANLLRLAGESVLPLLLIDPLPPPFAAREDLHLGDESPEHDKHVYELKSALYKRNFQGRWNSRLDNPQASEAALRVAVAFQKAMALYQPAPYAHPVNLFASSRRCGSKGWGDTKKRQSIFSGTLKIVEVGESHRDILDVRNTLFKEAIADYMQNIVNIK